ncbi:hypothetical protein, partial [Halomonas elongata]|uniref:hypothetical protein n=1 Tax=Halomonas elongata TaxID=2746 RepID=UPI001CED96F6
MAALYSTYATGRAPDAESVSRHEKAERKRARPVGRALSFVLSGQVCSVLGVVEHLLSLVDDVVDGEAEVLEQVAG